MQQRASCIFWGITVTLWHGQHMDWGLQNGQVGWPHLPPAKHLSQCPGSTDLFWVLSNFLNQRLEGEVCESEVQWPSDTLQSGIRPGKMRFLHPSSRGALLQMVSIVSCFLGAVAPGDLLAVDFVQTTAHRTLYFPGFSHWSSAS
jgi:hypothetical protein